MKNRKIAVIGLWHLGSVTALGLAELGHSVVAYDQSESIISSLKKGIPHLFEPEFEKLLRKNRQKKRISFTTNLSDIIGCDLIYITFDTPLDNDDQVDISPLFAITEKLKDILKKPTVIVIASQVPIGTTELLFKNLTEKNIHLSIAYQPENLQLGNAFKRFFQPAMIVIGTQDKKTFKTIAHVYKKLTTKKINTTIKTAEFIKHAINAYLASSISFANELGNLADFVGANYLTASIILKHDERIGPYARIRPGLGFAGGTLARDLKILKAIGQKHSYPTHFINGILSVNELQKKWVVRTIQTLFKNNLSGKKIGILGLTYTPQTSTLRRSLSVETIHDLQKQYASVIAYDPKVDREELSQYTDIQTTRSLDSVFCGIDALVLMTAWPEFLTLDFKQIKKDMRTPIVIDPNNVLAARNLPATGFIYKGFGQGRL